MNKSWLLLNDNSIHKRIYSTEPCPTCGVAEGEPHKLGCSMEICPICSGNLSSCTCFTKGKLISLDEAITHIKATPSKAKKKHKREPSPTPDIEIYVDGSYYKKKYSWAFVVYKDGEEIFAKAGIGKDKNGLVLKNIAGEIEATKQAVQWLLTSGYKLAAIYHDLDTLDYWAHKQSKARHSFVEDYINTVYPIRNRLKFIKVYSHGGIIGNERADDLAYLAFGLKKGPIWCWEKGEQKPAR